MKYEIEEGFTVPAAKPRVKKSFEISKSAVCDKPTYIYALCDPVTNECRYVGKTVNIEKRFFAHCYDNFRNKSRCANWIKSLTPAKPILIVLEEIPSGRDWIEAEMFWIAYMRSLGVDLINHTKGGEGLSGYKIKEETKIKISLKNKGRKRTLEFRKNMSKLKKGKPLPLETQLKRIAAIKNPTEETREKRRIAATGRKHTEQSKIKMRETIAIKGRTATPEAIARCYEMAERNKGRVHTEETKAKMSAWQKGKPGNPRSEETRLRMSESHKAYWANKKAQKELSNAL